MPVAGEQLSPLLDQLRIDVGGHAKILTPSLRGAKRRSNPALRGGMDCFASLAMTNSDERGLSLRFRLHLCRLPREGGLKVVEQLYLHAVLAHDVGLLDH